MTASSNVTVKIAFDLAVNGVGDWFTLDDSTKGVLDNTSYVLSGEVLTDLSDKVRSVSVRRGRGRFLDKFAAGTAQIELDNRDRSFDPTYVPVSGSRTNLVPNPSFETGASGWDTGSQVLATVVDTLYSLSLDFDGVGVLYDAAESYTASGVVYSYPKGSAA